MVRISLQEQYENKDVIQQIYILKDEVDGVTGTAEDAKNTADDALSQVSAAYTQSNQAIQTANGAKSTAESALGLVSQAQADATQALTDAEQAQTDADNAVASGSVVVDAVSAKLRLVRGTGYIDETAIPIASASQTGMMNAQTYAGIDDLGRRVSALEGKSTTVYVTFPNDNPDQATITSVFTTKAGRAPVAGDYAVDIAKNLTYGYDGSTWTKVGSDVSVPQFTLNTPGLIKGSDEDGTVFAEADGTGSVKGWDELKQTVQNNTENIAGKQAALVTATASLTVEGWAENAQTVSVAGVTATNIVWIAPAPESHDAYGTAGIRATVQGEGTLTFTCTAVPTEALTVNVVIG